jgi:hypothetical protein
MKCVCEREREKEEREVGFGLVVRHYVHKINRESCSTHLEELGFVCCSRVKREGGSLSDQPKLLPILRKCPCFLYGNVLSPLVLLSAIRVCTFFYYRFAYKLILQA